MQTFDDHAKAIRKTIKQYDAVSLLGELIKISQKISNMKANGQIAMPWVALLAIDWVISLYPPSGKRQASEADAYHILNRIWTSQSLAVGVNNPARVQMRALLAPQIAFQKKDRDLAYFFVRMKCIIESDDKNGYAFKDAFCKTANVDFDIFFQISFMLTLWNMSGPVTEIKFSHIIEILHPYFSTKDISASINYLSSTISYLVRDVNPEGELDGGEYFRESLFFKSPFVLMSDRLMIVHQTATMIGISESLERIFISREQSYRMLFTKCFEEYISKIHKDFQYSFLREAGIKAHYESEDAGNRKVVDFLITDQSFNVFIDAKGIFPTNSVLSALTKYKISKRVKKQHIKALNQIVDTARNLQDSNFSGLVEIDKRFGVVITHQDYFLGTGEAIFDYLHESEISGIIKAAEDVICLKNVHFMTIEQYEKVLCIVSECRLKLSDFFEFVEERMRSPQTALMIMDQYVEKFSIRSYGESNVPNGAVIVLNENEKLFDRAQQVMEHNLEYWRGLGRLGDPAIKQFLSAHHQIQESTYFTKL